MNKMSKKLPEKLPEKLPKKITQLGGQTKRAISPALGFSQKQGYPRYFSGVNWIGLWTLYEKEVWRFIKIFIQTVAGPAVNGLLFLAVFSLALGATRPSIGGVSFIQFLAPGLIMMSVVQNAFANTSSAILISKIQGNVVDYLMPPLSPGELNTGIALAGMTRGIIVASFHRFGDDVFCEFDAL